MTEKRESEIAHMCFSLSALVHHAARRLQQAVAIAALYQGAGEGCSACARITTQSPKVIGDCNDCKINLPGVHSSTAPL